MPHAATIVAGDARYLVTDEPGLVDVAVWHAYLQRSYWASGMPIELLRKACEHSLCVGVYELATTASGDRESTGSAESAEKPAMVGGGRVVTDRATYAYLSDVFVLEEHRGRGLSKAMMDVIMSHPDLQGLRRFALFTRDAHELYRRYGFDACAKPELYMERKFGGYGGGR